MLEGMDFGKPATGRIYVRVLVATCRKGGAPAVALILAFMFSGSASVGWCRSANPAGASRHVLILAQEAQDRVRLKSGAEVKARVIAMNSQSVTYAEGAGKATTAKKDDVTSVELGDPPPSMAKAEAALLNQDFDQAILSYKAALKEILEKKGGRALHKQFIYLKLAQAMNLKGSPDDALETLRDLRDECGDCWLRADSFQRSLEIAKVKGGEAYEGILKEMTEEQIAKQFLELKKLRPDQLVELDAGYESLLKQHEPMKKYAVRMYGLLDREHTLVHQKAADLKRAMAEVDPFLTRYAQIKAKPDEFKVKARELYDECKALTDRHGGTTLGVKLLQVLWELKKFLEENAEPTWEQKFVPLVGEVRVSAKRGEFAQALKLIGEFGANFKEKDSHELSRKLNDEREYLKRESVAFVNHKITQAKNDLSGGSAKKEVVKKKLEALRVDLEGYRDALEKLNSFIVTIK